MWSHRNGEQQPLLPKTSLNLSSSLSSQSSSSHIPSASSSQQQQQQQQQQSQTYVPEPVSPSSSNPHGQTDHQQHDNPRSVHFAARHRSFRKLAITPLYSCIVDRNLPHPVYMNIHRIRRDIVAIVEDYLSLDQLQDVRINIAVVRPLVDKLYDMEDVSIVYCLMVNRAKFLAEQNTVQNRNNVNFTRATLCELVATRILRRYGEDAEPQDRLLLLANILVAGFHPFLNAPPDVIAQADDTVAWAHFKPVPALEVAIVTGSKMFLSSSTCQKVVSAIYDGRIIYTPSSFFDLIPDHYKKTPITLYNPRKAPLLNQYRLIVPRVRNALDKVQFVVLLFFYFLFMAERNPARVTWREICFSVYTFGWCLDQLATILEHGWGIYSQNLWSFLDVGFMGLYAMYICLRTYGAVAGEEGLSIQGIDLLVMAAPILVPRLAFNLMSNNMVFLSIRAMISDFALLTCLSAWCFCGFLMALNWLSEGSESPWVISKWLLWIWFGLDGTGISNSVKFHPLLGPALTVAFSFLGNTLFLTVFVSVLTNHFAQISCNSSAEIQFRVAVSTLEAVKSDATFAYQPPFNIVAIFMLVPLKFLVSPRWFHKIHVAAVRAVNLPTLVVISLLERYVLDTFRYPPPERDTGSASTSRTDPETPNTARPTTNLNKGKVLWKKFHFTAHPDLAAVFDFPPSDSIEDAIAADDEFTHHLIRRQYVRPKTRRDSTFGNLSQTTPITSLSGAAGAVGVGPQQSEVTELSRRLDMLENRSARIESLLEKLVATFPPASSEERVSMRRGDGFVLSESPSQVSPLQSH
ncbi:hypothetical protein CFIMG_003217RA [Ceratocystis fimbriata CBS 114723]|uniref:Calcium channel YVC1 n=1 Tax=Ceratocystis fimbriata CBS 114723 TaxID=1035309 RepID=A0A2C5XBR9_9PEZI|nr:hypothetical protein CFIMG_003217RA [Ceratocystis fimbriata CBS 114723]